MTSSVNSGNNLYKNFSRINYNNSREFLSYTQSFEPLPSPSTLIQTQKQDTVETKKTNKSKGKKLLEGAFTLIGIGMAIFLAYKGIKSPQFKNFLNTGKDKYAQVKKQLPIIKENKIFKNANNALCNANNLKDDVLDRFLKYKPENHKILGLPSRIMNFIGTKATDLYKKIARKTLCKDYTKAYDKVIKAGGSELDIQNFNSWFNNIEKEINDSLHKNPAGRISSWSELTKNSGSGFVGKAKGIFKNLTSENLANSRIDDVIKKSKETIQINPEWSDELKKAVSEFNQVKLKTGEKLIPRLRDIVCGTAPSDLCTIATGVAVGTSLIVCADTPEERKSTIINKGIPLGFTLSGYALGAILNLSGATALLAGFGIGKIAQFITSKIDKQITTQEENFA